MHSRVGGTYGFPENVRGIVTPNPHIRTDIDVPVFDLQMEGDYVALRSHLARQPDSAHFRLWEMAGGAHSETPRWVIEVPPPLDHSMNCKDPINAAPGHAVVKAALHALVVWVRMERAAESSAARIGRSGGARSHRARQIWQRQGRHSSS